jgi:hypothetical protein
MGAQLMNFIARYPNFSTLLIAATAVAIALAILMTAFPPHF